jgi:hypothetical protein
MESLGAANMEGIKLGFHRWGYNGYIYIAIPHIET